MFVVLNYVGNMLCRCHFLEVRAWSPANTWIGWYTVVAHPRQASSLCINMQFGVTRTQEPGILNTKGAMTISHTVMISDVCDPCIIQTYHIAQALVASVACNLYRLSGPDLIT